MLRRLAIIAVLSTLASGFLSVPAQAATLTPISLDCSDAGGQQVVGQVGDTVQVTVTGPCTFSISTPGIVTWTNGTTTDPLASGSTTLTFTLLAEGVTTWTVLNTMDYPIQFIVSDLGLFSCSVAGDQSQSFTGAVGDSFTFFANGSCDLSASTPGVITWSAGGATDPTSVVNQLVTVSLIADGTAQLFVQWPYYPDTGGRLTIDVTVSGSSPAPAPAQPAATIPAWVQSIGRASADAGCPDGWGPSWQEWAVPVTGGWVCTREVPAVGD